MELVSRTDIKKGESGFVVFKKTEDVWVSYLKKRRQVLLMELGKIEDLLGIERTKPPRVR